MELIVFRVHKIPTKTIIKTMTRRTINVSL